MNFKNVLFLCTGNYFRSRFAEEYFNARAQELGYGWRSISRGVRQNLYENLRPDPLSPFTVQGLAFRNIYSIDKRFPILASDQDFRAERIIAVCEREHRPFIEQHYRQFLPKIQWWHIEDVDYVDPHIAMSVLVDHVERLLESCVKAACTVI